MHTTLTLLLALLLAGAGIAAAQSQREPELQAIDQFIETEMQRDRVPGVALAIVHNNQIVYLRGYGTNGNGQPVTPETGFILRSMSKSFTALAIMQLVERDQIQLDAPAITYLPWFRVADAAATAQITVRHLLNHTSGIPTQAPRAQGASLTLQDHVRALASVALRNPPGTVHEYASPNYQVLGAIVEQVSGQSFADYVQQQIFAPLDMRSSYTDQTQAIANGMARGHRYWFGFPVPVTLAHEHDRLPTASMISSAQDLSHYLIAQLNGGTFAGQSVLSPANVAEMQRPTAPSEGFSYAMGWRVGPVEGVPAIHHGGIVPHFRGKMVLLPEQQWGVAVLTNVSTAFPLPIQPTSHRLADAIAGYLVGQPLSHNSYSQSLLYLVIAAGMALVVLNQLSSLVRLGRWRAGLATRSRRSSITELVVEAVWPVVAVLGVPRVFGLPWSELLRGTPDMAYWLITIASLGLLTAAAKLIVFMRARSTPAPGAVVRRR